MASTGHGGADADAAAAAGQEQLHFTYEFQNLFHPLVAELLEQLKLKSLRGTYDPKFLEELNTKGRGFFDAFYRTAQNDQEFHDARGENADLATVQGTSRSIELGDEPYANYNWELFYHVPVGVAVHLSKSQRFAEAQRWFHYVFDPTSTEPVVDPATDTSAADRCWKFIGFRGRMPTQIDKLLVLLSRDAGDLVLQKDKDDRTTVLNGINKMITKPFQPHAVARTRQIAYQYYVVMKYLDNLIAWGDHLFRQDTAESINEAMQRYVLAANLLGARPQRVPPMGRTRPRNYAELRAGGKDAMGNLLVELEGLFPFNLDLPELRNAGKGSSGSLFGIGESLYFCVPNNDRMLRYWDTVADRLFKIRNSLNIEGVFRQLALFDPPIDPGMLVKAAAAGINVAAVLNGLSQPAGPMRASLLIQKALELCGEVRGFGGALLAALEKGDGERMALLRQGHEIEIQELSKEVRFLQWRQAQESTESLIKTRASTVERYKYYQRMLGGSVDANAVPERPVLDRRPLTEENFDEAYSALVGQYERPVPLRAFSNLKLATSSPASDSGAAGSGQMYLNAGEDKELNHHLPMARDLRLGSSAIDTIASVLVFIPDFNANIQFWGLGATTEVGGGMKISEAGKIAADIMRTASAWQGDQGGIVSKVASYERRADDWLLQSNLAARELMQLGRQLIGSLIAEQVAHHEYLNVGRQIENSREVDRLMREKFTNAELYGWMQGELCKLYYEYYRFAFDTARKAEQAMKRELMRPEVDATDFVKFNYWDAGRKGLLSGEALALDLKRMELAYHENNKREFELTKHVSLRQLAPEALLALNATGSCEVSIPEWAFDVDCPGHYMRRIKSVGLSIPAVAGPYTGVNCSLTLMGSTVRKSSLLSDGEYARKDSADDRFVDYVGATQSIVTSGGSNDSGLFEANLRDDRLLPFEGAGAVSSWKLELPEKFRSFDYNSISDVVLHVRYTARQGGQDLRGKATERIQELIGEASASGLAVFLSLKHEFPGEWARFVDGQRFVASVRREHFPYFLRGPGLEINIESVAVCGVAPRQARVKALSLDQARRAALDGDLNDPAKNAFALSLDAGQDGTPLSRDPRAELFLLVNYSVTVV